MSRKKPDINILNHPSFLDLWANTVGALIFIIFITFLVTGAIGIFLKFHCWPLKIITENLPEGVVGQNYWVALAVTGGQELGIKVGNVSYGTYRWKLIKGNLPPGLNFDSQWGIIYGIPQKPCEVNITVMVDDEPVKNEKGKVIIDRKPAYKKFKLKVVPAPPPPPLPLRIKTRELPKAICNVSYVVYLSAIGGVPPYKWSCEGLPQGLSCSDEGVIKGCLSKDGKYEIRIEVSDREGKKEKVYLTIEVLPLGKIPYSKLKIVTKKLPNARVNEDYYVKLAAEGGIIPYHWRIIEGLEMLKEHGLNFDPNLGEIKGKPVKKGNLKLKIQVETLRYGITDRDQKTFSLFIKEKASPYESLKFLW